MSFYPTDDLRIDKIRPLIPPAILIEEIPITEEGSRVVAESRLQVRDVMDGRDDRLLVVVGPCSIHDVNAALEYGQKLAVEAKRLRNDLLIVMRVYFEKPRTTVGWKGLINDPLLDGSFAINKGLRLARGLLVDLLNLGVPCATEFLDTITPQFIADLVSWGAIGARTTESQVHRELASGLSMPVGFKNGTDGNVQIAVDAIRAASHPHHFLSVTKQGIHAIVATKGNDRCHVILRGSNTRPELRAGARGAGGSRARGGQAARAHHDRREPRQQQQGPPQPAQGRWPPSASSWPRASSASSASCSRATSSAVARTTSRARRSTVRASPTLVWAGARPSRCSMSSRRPCVHAVLASTKADAHGAS